MHFSVHTFLLPLIAAAVLAYEVPANLAALYTKHKPGQCTKLLSPDTFNDGGANSTSTFAYCGQIPRAIFLHSTAHGGQYDNMDIDCDGLNRLQGDCSDDPTGQPQTAFASTLTQFGISDLDANVHPYVVFGNRGTPPLEFDPEAHGMRPLSVMAVVCAGQLIFGIWGDINAANATGEASVALAKLCFPNERITGLDGHGADDVLYVGFVGDRAVPGKTANWTAATAVEFQDSIQALGMALVAGLSDNETAMTSALGPSGTGTGPAAGSSTKVMASAVGPTQTSGVGRLSAVAPSGCAKSLFITLILSCMIY